MPFIKWKGKGKSAKLSMPIYLLFYIMTIFLELAVVCMYVVKKNVKSSNKLAIKKVQVRTVFAGGVNLLN